MGETWLPSLGHTYKDARFALFGSGYTATGGCTEGEVSHRGVSIQRPSSRPSACAAGIPYMMRLDGQICLAVS